MDIYINNCFRENNRAYKSDATSVDDTETVTLRFFYNEKSGK